MNAALNQQARRLLARYGRRQVLDAIAAAEAARVSGKLRAAETEPTRTKAAARSRTTRRRKTATEVVEAAQVDSEIRPVAERIAAAYESRQILPELWRVRKLLASEGVDPDRVRSRADALPKLIRVLAGHPRERLEYLLNGWREHVERGDLAILADAILGPAKSATPAGER